MTDFKSPEWDRKFRSIFADIKQGKCVVLVGPEIVKIGGKPLRQVLRDQLLSTNADDIAHYYERDGFFLFRDKIAKEDVEREVVLFYQDHQSDVDEAPLLNLVRLRAHVFLSINPDSFLSDVAYKYGIRHRFAYFQHGGTAVQDVEPPSADMPLFYNLFGSLQRDDSLVLDYDDLFRLLSSLLGAPGLPNHLALALQQAKHFLFVGFDFDKWYSQLILRILSGEKAIRKFAVDHTEKNENTTTFLVKQFGIEFIKDEALFLEALAERAAAEGALRDIVEAQTPEVVRLTHYLQNGDVLGALNHLKTNAGAQSDATILLARYHELKDREARKTIDSSDYSVEYNRIVDAILETIKIHL
jgi:hypothetical protein